MAENCRGLSGRRECTRREFSTRHSVAEICLLQKDKKSYWLLIWLCKWRWVWVAEGLTWGSGSWPADDRRCPWCPDCLRPRRPRRCDLNGRASPHETPSRSRPPLGPRTRAIHLEQRTGHGVKDETQCMPYNDPIGFFNSHLLRACEQRQVLLNATLASPIKIGRFVFLKLWSKLVFSERQKAQTVRPSKRAQLIPIYWPALHSWPSKGQNLSI